MKEVEDYANSDDVKFDDESPHHVFHIYSPAVLCNLLPVPVTVMDEVVICSGLPKALAWPGSLDKYSL